MRPPSSSLLASGACALALVLAAPASAVLTPDQFSGTVSVQGSTLRVDDATSGPGTADTDANEPGHIGVGPLAPATFGAAITGFTNVPPSALAAGPGCAPIGA